MSPNPMISVRNPRRNSAIVHGGNRILDLRYIGADPVTQFAHPPLGEKFHRHQNHAPVNFFSQIRNGMFADKRKRIYANERENHLYGQYPDLDQGDDAR